MALPALRVASRAHAPILKEVPIEAEHQEQTTFDLSTLASVGLPAGPGIPLPSLPTALNIPVIARGSASGSIRGQWYHVTFSEVLNNPSVACVAQGRTGTAPKPSIPSIKIIAANLAYLPTINASSISIHGIRQGNVPSALGRFDCGWAISGLTDGLNSLMGTLEGVLERINELLADVTANFNDVVNSIKSVDAKVDDLKNKINTTFKANVDNTNTAFTQQGVNIRDSVNSGLTDVITGLYNAWGLASNYAITPISVRNVSSVGFEFQSLGNTKIYYIAIGSRR